MGCRNFESYIGPKIGLGIYETTMHFFGPQICKKPRNFLGFWGWHLFCTTLLEGLCKKDAIPPMGAGAQRFWMTLAGHFSTHLPQPTQRA